MSVIPLDSILFCYAGREFECLKAWTEAGIKYVIARTLSDRGIEVIPNCFVSTMDLALIATLFDPLPNEEFSIKIKDL